MSDPTPDEKVLEQIKERDAATTAAHLEGDQSLAWKRVLLDRRILLERVKRTEDAMEVIERFGGIQGDHHRCWVLDQAARFIKGPDYDQWVVAMKAGEDGPDSYEYDVGIAP